MPADRAERLKELEVWPEEKFWPPKNKHATGIPFSHVPSQERLKELGILVPDYLVYHLGGSQFAIGKREVGAKIKNLATERLLAEGLPEATVSAAISKIRPRFKIVSTNLMPFLQRPSATKLAARGPPRTLRKRSRSTRKCPLPRVPPALDEQAPWHRLAPTVTAGTVSPSLCAMAAKTASAGPRGAPTGW